MNRLRRIVERTVLAMATLLAIGGARAQTVVTAASAQLTVGTLPLLVAQSRGLFAAQGIAFRIIEFDGGGLAVQALASGSTDLCICAADHALRLAARGMGGAVLVVLAEKHVNALVAKASAPWTDLASLKGQRLIVTSPGSLTDNTLRWAIRGAGLDPDKDFVIVSAGTGPAMRAAVDSGGAAAAMFTTPDVQSLLAEGGQYRAIVDFRGLDYPSLTLLATGPWLKTHPDTARAVARAVVEAEGLIQRDPTAIRQALRATFPKLSPEVLETVAREQTASGLSRDGRLNQTGYDNLLAVLRAADASVKPAPYEAIVATAYLPTAPLP